MKNILLLLLSFAFGVTTAQKIIEKNIDYKGQYIEMDVRFASEIKVKTWDKQTIYFKADIYTKNSAYLDLYELNIRNTSSSLSIESNPERIFKKSWDDWKKNNPGKKRRYSYTEEDPEYKFKYILYVPKNAKFAVSSINGHLTSEIIEGDFTADLINGDIDIDSYTGNLDLKTINGAIDLKIRNAHITAETIHGDIYADEKLQLNSSSRHIGQKITGKVNTGKNRVQLHTINGNMYLRL